jgi:hypothetical protein
MDQRPKVPQPVARQLRQEAGFGCCVCGNPIIQYHHIVEWVEEAHFRPQDMMVLCPLHHDQATKGALPHDRQREYKKHPRNIVRGYVNGLLALTQDYCAASLGSTQVVGEGPFLLVDQEPLIGFYMGPHNLELSLCLFDQNDAPLLEIDRNEWISGDPLPWDIQADWRQLTVRQRQRDIILSLDARRVPLELRGKFWRHGQAISISPQGIEFEGAPLNNSGIRDLALVGASISIDTTSTGMKITPQAGSPGAVFVSWPNPRERLYRAREAWRRLRNQLNKPAEHPG